MNLEWLPVVFLIFSCDYILDMFVYDDVIFLIFDYFALK